MNKKEIDSILEQSNNVLGKKSDKQIQQYVSEGHKKQNKERASKGGTKSMPKGIYGDVQKKGNKIAKEKGVGIHNKNNANYKNWKSKAGIIGAKRQMNDGIGIHIDKETRREWSRKGGYAVIEQLNKEKICPYCGTKSKGAGYNRWHGNNCKHK